MAGPDRRAPPPNPPAVPDPAPPGPVLLTGAAGFIGARVGELLLAAGRSVVGVDDLNDYYDPALKRSRLADLEAAAAAPGAGAFTFRRLDLADRPAAATLFDPADPPRCVIHLAAQAGVRHSLSAPHAYARANLIGFLNVLEGCRALAAARPADPPHLVFASSSSVYGMSDAPVLRTADPADHPVSLYAATKRANELMAHSYAHLFGVPCSGVRFFTVYGPRGRPDMAVWRFTDRVLRGEPIDVYGGGRMRRGFTYVDDAAGGVVRLAAAPPPAPAGDAPPASPDAGAGRFRVYNLGTREPAELMTLIETIEAACGRPAEKRFLPMQPGDVRSTAADTASLEAVIGPLPQTPLDAGVRAFVDWYRAHRGL